jgi:hypothetical protein
MRSRVPERVIEPVPVPLDVVLDNPTTADMTHALDPKEVMHELPCLISTTALWFEGARPVVKFAVITVLVLFRNVALPR